MIYDAEIWGPHYWFVLITIAMIYPTNPNAVIKKKYYNFIHDLSIFIPEQKSSKHFSQLLNKYPVAPYLDSRSSLIRWVHFIHNKMNKLAGKEQCSLIDALNQYYDLYKPKELKNREMKKKREKVIFVFVVCLTLISIGYFYRK